MILVIAGWVLLTFVSMATSALAQNTQSQSSEPSYPAEWNNLDVDGLAKIACDLDRQKDKDTKSQKALLASFVSREYKRLSDKNLNNQAWLELARRLSGNLEKETRKQLSKDISQRHLADDKTIAAYSFNELNQYTSAIFAMGQTESASIVWAKWTVLSNQIPSLSGKNLVRLASWIRSAGKARPMAAKRIIQCVEEKYLNNEASVRKESTSHWRSLAGNLVCDMDSKQRNDWAKRIQTAYLQHEMNVAGVLDIENALAVLRRGTDRAFLVGWMNGKTWTKWSGGNIARLASRLRWDAKEAKQRRGEIISHFESKILGEEKAIQDIRGQDWASLVESVRQDLSSEQCDHWMKRIRQGFLTKTMDISELAQVEQALNALKLLAGQYFTYEWTIANEKTWQEWSGKNLAALASHVAGNAPLAQQARGKLMDYVQKKYLVDSKAAMAIEDADWQLMVKSIVPYMKRKQADQWIRVLSDMLIARHISKDPSPKGMEQATRVMYEFQDSKVVAVFIQKWGMKVYEATLGTPEARKTIDAYTLCLVGEGIRLAKWNNQSKDFPEYAEALAMVIARGEIRSDHSWEKYMLWATPLFSEKNRLKVREALLDEKGRPHIGGVLILSCAYRDYASLKDWLGYLETLVNEPDIDADTKAYRLLARGLAQGMEWKHYAPWRGRAWLDHAIATAETDDVRLDIARQIIRAYEKARDPVGALAMLDHISGTTSKKVAQELSKDRKGVIAVQRRLETQEQQRLQKASFKSSRAHRAVLEKRLATAREKGDSESIHRYEKLLQNMQ